MNKYTRSFDKFGIKFRKKKCDHKQSDRVIGILEDYTTLTNIQLHLFINFLEDMEKIKQTEVSHSSFTANDIIKWKIRLKK